MSKKMAMSATNYIALMMGRTFMEYVKKGRGKNAQWVARKGTVLLLRSFGRKYEIRIAGARVGQYRFPFQPQTFTAKELDEFRRFIRNMELYRPKRKMLPLKNSKKGSI